MARSDWSVPAPPLAQERPVGTQPAVAGRREVRRSKVLFWRMGKETRTRHRNPLFDPALGITHRILADGNCTVCTSASAVLRPDSLVALAHRQCPQLESTQAVIDEESVMHLWNQLKRHYRRQRKAKIPVQELAGFTLSMMGSRSHPAMKMKGVETKDLLPFVMEQLKAHRAFLPHPQVRRLIHAGEALARVLDTSDESPLRINIPRPTRNP